jgi:small subunit ribosomal protein S20
LKIKAAGRTFHSALCRKIMPNIASAKKRLRQNIATRDRNRSSRSFIRNRCKNVIKSVQAGNVEDAEKLFREAVKSLDQAGAKRIIHKNAAARKKSRLSAMIRKMKEKAKAAA